MLCAALLSSPVTCIQAVSFSSSSSCAQWRCTVVSLSLAIPVLTECIWFWCRFHLLVTFSPDWTFYRCAADLAAWSVSVFRCRHSAAPFLAAFAKLLKPIITFVMSVRTSAWNLNPTERIFMKFDIWLYFENTEATGRTVKRELYSYFVIGINRVLQS
jgi:hypothetical protein